MAVELEGLEFQIESHSESAGKGIDALVNSLGRLKNATKGGVGLSSTNKQIERLSNATKNFQSNKLTELANGLTSLSRVPSIKLSSSIATRITEISTALHTFTSTDIENLEDLSNVLRGMQGLNDLKISATVPTRLKAISDVMRGYEWSDIEKLEALRDVLSDLNNLNNVTIPRVNDQGQVTPQTPTDNGSNVPQDSGVEDVDAGVQQVTEHTSNLKNILSGLGGVFKKAFSTGTGVLKSLLSVTGKVTKSFLNLATAISRRSMSRLVGSVKQATSSLGALFNSLKRIAMYRAIRAVISSITQGFSTGISNLYQWSLLVDTKFANSMNKIATSTLYLKNSLGAMVAPLINQLAPILDVMIDKFVEILNLVNQTFAKLSGADTYTAARKVATQWAEVESDVKKSTDAIKRYTLAFDELNILGKPDTGNKGKSSEDETDYPSMFENRPIENTIGSFLDRIKAAFQSENWKELGTIIGNKVNDSINNINWSSIGQNVGKRINGAVQTAYYTLNAIDFTNIGSKIADLLNNALSNIDFTFVGRLIIKPFTALGDIIIGAIETVDWGLVTRSVSDFVVGLFNETGDWLNSVDWNQFGKSLTNGIIDVITNLKYSEIVSSFGSLLFAALKASLDILLGIGTAIAEKLESTDWDSVWKTTKDKIKEGFKSIDLKSLWEGAKGLGKSIVDVSVKLNQAGWKTVTSWVHILYGSVKNDVSVALTKAKDATGKAWTSVTAWVKKSFGNVKNDVSVALIAKAWKTVSSWVHGYFGTTSNDALITLIKTWPTVTKWVHSNFGNTSNNAQVGLKKGGWSTVSNWVKRINTNSVVSAIVALAKAKTWTTIAAWVKSLKTYSTVFATVDLIKGAWNSITGWINSLKTNSKVYGKVGLSKDSSSWTSVASYVNGLKTNSKVYGNVGLRKENTWESLSGWVSRNAGNSTVGASVELAKSGWSNITDWATNGKGYETIKLRLEMDDNYDSVDALIDLRAARGLAKGGFFSGGIYHAFKSGGVIAKNFSQFWNTVPKYGRGTANAHGSMFVAGESGAELVGHVNGRTEVLNRSQLGQIMHRSIVDGMQAYNDAMNSLISHVTTCTNAVIRAVLASPEIAYSANGYTAVQEDYKNIMRSLANEQSSNNSFTNDDFTDAVTDGVREGMNEATARQNDILRNMLQLLISIDQKDFTAEITSNSIVESLRYKNRRDGSAVVSVNL